MAQALQIGRAELSCARRPRQIHRPGAHRKVAKVDRNLALTAV